MEQQGLNSREKMESGKLRVDQQIYPISITERKQTGRKKNEQRQKGQWDNKRSYTVLSKTQKERKKRIGLKKYLKKTAPNF